MSNIDCDELVVGQVWRHRAKGYLIAITNTDDRSNICCFCTNGVAMAFPYHALKNDIFKNCDLADDYSGKMGEKDARARALAKVLDIEGNIIRWLSEK